MVRWNDHYLFNIDLVREIDIVNTNEGSEITLSFTDGVVRTLYTKEKDYTSERFMEELENWF